MHRSTIERPSDPEILLQPAIGDPRQRCATAEVDPDDIEAAIEVAPPARAGKARSNASNAVAIAKPKKPQS